MARPLPLADAIVLTCEHGGNLVPADYTELFASRRARAALQSHRGYDLGALAVAKHLQRLLSAPLIASQVTRLLVDLNRSQGHARLFSEFSRSMGNLERARLLRRHYEPHRQRVERAVQQGALERRALHLAIHSFTPRLGGEVRTADIGLLYDPLRLAEKSLCLAWQRELSHLQPSLRIRRNYPYRGSADGLTTALRRSSPANRYLGIEVEINQRLVAGGARVHQQIATWIHGSLLRALASDS